MVDLTEGWLQGFMADRWDETKVSCASKRESVSEEISNHCSEATYRVPVLP